MDRVLSLTLRNACTSIWRSSSPVNENCCGSSSRVLAFWPIPKRIRKIISSRGASVDRTFSVCSLRWTVTNYAQPVYIISASLVNLVLCQVLMCVMIKNSLILIKSLLILFFPSFISDEESEKFETRETGLPCPAENLISA